MLKLCQCKNFLCKLRAEFDEFSNLLRPVMMNMAMTLVAWIYVYEMKTDDRLSAVYQFSGNNTTGNNYKDGFINAFILMIKIAISSFVLLLFVLWDYRGLIQRWLNMCCILILFSLSGSFFYDLLKSLEMSEEKMLYGGYLPVLVTAYGGFGCIAYFYHSAPLLLQQFYVLSNCSLISSFLLRCFPGYTPWFVLWLAALWDIFAVLTPIGPIRKVREKAGDYDHNVLRFLMFTADVRKTPDLADSETEAGSSSQQAETATKTSSSTPMSEKSEDYVVPQLEQPLLRRRVRQTTGADFVKTTDDILKEGDHIEMDRKREGSRVRKDKKSDVSSEDEVATEIEMNTDDDMEANTLDNHKKILESSSSSSDSSSDSSERSTTQEETKNVESKSITAADALKDGKPRLGMGDFVFYSILVGQAATTGDEMVPALPISIVLGTLFHFGYLFLVPAVMFYTELLFHNVLYALTH